MIRWFTVCIAWLLFSLSALASVNINTADQAELETLPGIGPSKASAILDYRVENGPFQHVDELDNVTGIGPATLSNLRPLVSTEGGGTATNASAAPAVNTRAAQSSSVNVNTATAKELEFLPGIGPSKAAAIVADRTENGPYGTCADLQRVHGIGPATVANISSTCAVQ
jgi:competence protein ComEA